MGEAEIDRANVFCGVIVTDNKVVQKLASMTLHVYVPEHIPVARGEVPTEGFQL